MGRTACTEPQCLYKGALYLLVPWSRKSRAITLFPLWPVRPVQSLSACTRVHFTFLCRGQERVELYLYSPYGPYGLNIASVPVQGCTLPLPFTRSKEGLIYAVFTQLVRLAVFVLYCVWFNQPADSSNHAVSNASIYIVSDLTNPPTAQTMPCLMLARFVSNELKIVWKKAFFPELDNNIY